MRPLHIGLSDQQRDGSCRVLNQALANESLLVIKTRKVHWDVVGPQFLTLHKLLDEQYVAMAEFADQIAERIRSLGGYPLGTAAGFIEAASIEESPGEVSDATTALETLLADHEGVIRQMREGSDQCEDEFGDRGSTDFLTGIMKEHEKMAWMLRSFIEGQPLRSDGRVQLPPSATPSLA